jgi:hypothetical protein
VQAEIEQRQHRLVDPLGVDLHRSLTSSPKVLDQPG